VTGSLRLRDYPSAIVRITCTKCGRAGQYRKDTLLKAYGGDITLPDLRHEIARCERRDKKGDGCEVRFEGLA
jgi:hypothetical protein